MKTNKPRPEKNPDKSNAEDKGDCKCSRNCGCCDERKRVETTSVVKPVAVASMLTLISANAFAQEASPPGFWTDPFNSPMLPVFLTLGLLVITILLLVSVIAYVARVMGILVKQVEIEQAARLGIKLKPSLSWWERLWEKANATVPLEKEQDIDMGHDFDGIRELDNHLPPWWKGLFYATVIWSVLYLIVFHVTDSLPLSTDEFELELAEAEQHARELRALQPAEVIDESTLQYAADAEILGRGKIVFTSSNCMSCHRADGGGNTIGPNLTDEYWLHGGSARNIYSTVSKGVVEKGMPAWGKVMSARDVRDVTFYIMSLGGSSPPGGKAAQGELYKPEPKETAPDSTMSALIPR